ncbi:hypothetical protein ECANGB1_2295 [Enterospora canceri]|uniref:Uncharacterized protein n=1 Tax=Enterospora canceri TaxID=1081671 RepID=A0A1Y1S4U7_9MICR|nr:hypothetical protein ECANGB1_2295 [Enterospora canceri]
MNSIEQKCPININPYDIPFGQCVYYTTLTVYVFVKYLKQHNIVGKLDLIIRMSHSIDMLLDANGLYSFYYGILVQYDNLIFLVLLSYALSEYSQNINMLEYYRSHVSIPDIPRCYYFTYNCIFGTYLVVVLRMIGTASRLISEKYAHIHRRLITKLTTTVTTFNLILITLFWPLYFYDPILVKPYYTLIDGLNTPPFTEISMHLLPFMICIWMYREIRTPPDHTDRILLVLGGVYATIMLLICKYTTGIFPYLFLNEMGPTGFLFLSVIISLIGMILQVVLYRYVSSY